MVLKGGTASTPVRKGGLRGTLCAALSLCALLLLPGCGDEKELPPNTTVVISTKPDSGAQIKVNGEYRGESPLTLTGIEPGELVAEANKEGYKRAWDVVTVEDKADEQRIVLTMLPMVGYLSMDSEPPGARVYLDDTTSLGQTPLVRVPVPVGEHRYELTAEGYKPLTASITVEEDYQYHKVHALEHNDATLEVFSIPTNAQIWLNNQLQPARTPTRLQLPPGVYTVAVHLDGYIQKEQTISLKGSDTNRIELTMLEGNIPPGMLLIPPGEFICGVGTASPDERPQRKVFLPAFCIDKYEVTNVQWKAVFPAHTFDAAKGNFPVLGVSYNEALVYAAAVGKRLPTEEEWEKAARGTDGREYPWGNYFDATLCNVPQPGAKPAPVEVGKYLGGASPYGCMDMAGNAYEWTSSWYQAYPGNTVIEKEYGQQFRVLRGGSYRSKPFDARCARRQYDSVSSEREDYGLRCAMDAPAQIGGRNP